MPDLVHSLRTRDLGHLRIVASSWGLELSSTETEAALKELSTALLASGLVGEVIESLSTEAQSAIAALAGANGKIPWAAFVRRFGEVREVGAGRRDREQVYLNPISAAEVLFYRALLARAFFDTPSGPQEFAYIPGDLLPLVRASSLTPTPLLAKHPRRGQGEGTGVRGTLGRPATPKERQHPILATDHLLDDATTLLTALRMGIQPAEMQVPIGVVRGFLEAAGIMSGEAPQPDRVKGFLEMPRPQALDQLAEAWQRSDSFNELRLIPGLACEGKWSNQPLLTREFLLGLLAVLPNDKWWSLSAFVLAIKEKHPDFQRPAGDYDSWFIKRASDGSYLRGFEAWDEVDGELIRYFITGPLFWLGRVDLATPADNEVITAFRVSGERVTSSEDGKLIITSNGRIVIPRLVPRATRYQVSRFCEWDEAKADEYRYHVSTRSLARAKDQGLKVGQLLSLLAKNAAAPLPPAFVKALKRWELNGTEARMEMPVVLKVSGPKVLEELRKSKAGRFLGETLGPAAVVVKPGAQPKVLAALAEMGLLAENEAEEEA